MSEINKESTLYAVYMRRYGNGRPVDKEHFDRFVDTIEKEIQEYRSVTIPPVKKTRTKKTTKKEGD